MKDKLMMKPILTILALGLAVGLAGCGENEYQRLRPGERHEPDPYLFKLGKDKYELNQTNPHKLKVKIGTKWYPCKNGTDCTSTVISVKGKKQPAKAKVMPVEPEKGSDGGGSF